MIGFRLVLLWLIALASGAGPVEAQTAAYDWRKMQESLKSLSVAFDRDTAQAHAAPQSSAYDFDLRRICADSVEIFAESVVRERCADGGCVGRRKGLSEKAGALASQLEQRIKTDSNDDKADLFVPEGMMLTSEGAHGVSELALRASHDLWMRAWTDPLTASAVTDDRDQWLLLTRVWCGLTRSNALRAREYLAEFGFPAAETPESRVLLPAMVNIAIHAAWDAELTGPIHEYSQAAFERDQLHGYYAANLLDIDVMADSGKQAVGTLFSCENGRAYPDPPLAQPDVVAELRDKYGFPPLAETLAARSSRCPTAR